MGEGGGGWRRVQGAARGAGRVCVLLIPRKSPLSVTPRGYVPTPGSLVSGSAEEEGLLRGPALGVLQVGSHSIYMAVCDGISRSSPSSGRLIDQGPWARGDHGWQCFRWSLKPRPSVPLRPHPRCLRTGGPPEGLVSLPRRRKLPAGCLGGAAWHHGAHGRWSRAHVACISALQQICGTRADVKL